MLSFLKNRINNNAIFILILFLISCQPRDNNEVEKEFYLNQERDSLIVGSYIYVSNDTNIVPYYSYRQSGELIISSSPNFDTLNVEKPSFWYSQNDTIFILTLGDFRNETRKIVEKYYFTVGLDTMNLEYINTKNEVIEKMMIRL